MVYTCYLCKWRSDRYPRRSYHRFPLDKELKQQWLDILGMSNATIGNRTSLCCKHFEMDCFRFGLVQGRRILKTGSLPTLNPKNPIPPDFDSDEAECLEDTNNVESKQISSSSSSNEPQMVKRISLRLNEKKVEQKKENEAASNSAEESATEMDDEQVENDDSYIYNEPSNQSNDDVKPLNYKISRLKRKVLCLKRVVKRLHTSRCHMKLQIKELKRMVERYENENHLMQTKLGLSPQTLYEQLKMSKNKYTAVILTTAGVAT